MGLSLNPVDVWKLFSDSKRKDKEQIATWIENTAAEARKIADLWAELKYKKLAPPPDRSSNGSSKLAFDSSDWGGARNNAEYSRLDGSYRSASSVFDGRVDEDWLSGFSDSAAAVLTRRNEVKELYSRLFGKTTGLIFFDDRNREDQLDEFVSAVDLLTREAAALEVLARNFRASK